MLGGVSALAETGPDAVCLCFLVVALQPVVEFAWHAVGCCGHGHVVVRGTRERGGHPVHDKRPLLLVVPDLSQQASRWHGNGHLLSVAFAVGGEGCEA